jgi:hypothetical protein
MNKYIILDLDNCVSVDGWRRDRIQIANPDHFRRYHDYHSLAGFDQAGNRYLYWNRPGGIIILTSRPCHYRAITEHWLRIAGIRYTHLVMRNDDDHQPSVNLKQMQLRWLYDHYGVNQGEIVMAYDDVPEIVEMYKSNGLNAERKFIVEDH